MSYIVIKIDVILFMKGNNNNNKKKKLGYSHI